MNPREDFAFYSKRNGSYRGALSREGLGFGLNVNRIPWLLSREQNMRSKGRSQEPRQEMLMAGLGSGVGGGGVGKDLCQLWDLS